MSESELEEFNFGEEVPIIQDFSETDVEEVRYVLRKFDGDFTDAEIDSGLAGLPVEELVFVNGELVEHIINGAEGGK